MLNLWKPEPKKRSGIVNPRRAVVPGVPLTRYTNNELAVRVARITNTPNPGVAWARLMNESNRPKKDVARDAVLQLCTIERFPHLSMLTFPASEWRFERALLKMREAREAPRRTTIMAVERDVAVYRAAVHNIPRGSTPRLGRVRVAIDDLPEWASECVQTVKIDRFYRATFEDYATREYNGLVRKFDAAWLDFMGKLTPSRLDAVERFWKRQVRSLLVVTLMNGRTCDWITGRIHGAGSIEQLLASTLGNCKIEHAIHYGDGAPMVQIAVRRTGLPRVEREVPHV